MSEIEKDTFVLHRIVWGLDGENLGSEPITLRRGEVIAYEGFEDYTVVHLGRNEKTNVSFKVIEKEWEVGGQGIKKPRKA